MMKPTHLAIITGCVAVFCALLWSQFAGIKHAPKLEENFDALSKCGFGHSDAKAVPRLRWDDPKAAQLLKNREAVVLVGAKITSSAKKWSSPDYIGKYSKEYVRVPSGPQRGSIVPVALMTMVSKTNNFLFGRAPNFGHWTFNTTTEETWFTFKMIRKFLKNYAQRDFKFYGQQVVAKGSRNHEISKIGSLRNDIMKFKWDRLKSLGGFMEKDFMTSIFLGDTGAVTPLHFDGEASLLSQSVGSKCAILADQTDKNFETLKPFPISHPNARQSQLTHDRWSMKRRKFNMSRIPKNLDNPQVAYLKPGDALYIPRHTWHEIASIYDGDGEITLSFSFRGKTKTPKKPLGRMGAQTFCEEKLQKMHGYDAGTILQQLDEYLQSASGTLPSSHRQSDAEKLSLSYESVAEACKEFIDPVLSSGEDVDSFLEKYFRGRFLNLSREPDSGKAELEKRNTATWEMFNADWMQQFEQRGR